jgi:hypothetical protein
LFAEHGYDGAVCGCAYLASHPNRRQSHANAAAIDAQGRAGTRYFVVVPAEKESGQSVSVVIFKCGHALIKCTRRLMEQRVTRQNSQADSRIRFAGNARNSLSCFHYSWQKLCEIFFVFSDG